MDEYRARVLTDHTRSIASSLSVIQVFVTFAVTYYIVTDFLSRFLGVGG